MSHCAISTRLACSESCLVLSDLLCTRPEEVYVPVLVIWDYSELIFWYCRELVTQVCALPAHCNRIRV